MSRGPNHGRDVSLGGLLRTLKGQPSTLKCSWHLEVSSEFVHETETHRHEREFRRLVVAIDLEPRVVALPLPRGK